SHHHAKVFLVKKVKLEISPPGRMENAYRHSDRPRLRLHDKAGYISDYISPVVYDGESDSGIKVPS
ncbi:transcriptional repressor scratch 1-like protein, partial [Lates japonicus]